MYKYCMVKTKCKNTPFRVDIINICKKSIRQRW